MLFYILYSSNSNEVKLSIGAKCGAFCTDTFSFALIKMKFSLNRYDKFDYCRDII